MRVHWFENGLVSVDGLLRVLLTGKSGIYPHFDMSKYGEYHETGYNVNTDIFQKYLISLSNTEKTVKKK